MQKNRRLHASRRLTTRLLLRITLWSLAFVSAVAITHFAYSYQLAKQQLVQELVIENEQRIEQATDLFRQAEYSAELLAEQFLKHYQAFVNDEVNIEKFDRWHETTHPNVLRLKPDFFEGVQQDGRWFQYISTFVGPREEPITNELKARTVIAETVLNELAPAWSAQVTNTHISMPENILTIYSQEHAWGLLADASLVITDYAVVRSTLQAHNPERNPIWTGLYYDLSAGYWTITYQLPVDYNGKHLISTSHDIALNSILQALIEPTDSRATHFLFNQSAELLASAEAFNDDYQQKGILDLDQLTNPLYRQIYTQLEQHGFAGDEFVLYDAIPQQVVIAKKLPGFEWWHVTLYPYRTIQQQALVTPLTISLATLALLAMILLIVYLMINRHVSRPLHQLAEMSMLIGDKKYQEVMSSKLLTEHLRSEVGMLVRSFRTMAARLLENQNDLEKQVANRTLELAEANAKLEQIAHLDGLTGLLNRRAFDQDFTNVYKNLITQPVALLFCDLDYFKQFNDNYGHQAGDQALIDVSAILDSTVHGKAYRYGGEEIALLIDCPNADSADSDAVAIAEQLREAVHQQQIPHEFCAHNVLTLSIGVHVIQAELSIADNLKAADEKLYAAKKAGRNLVR